MARERPHPGSGIPKTEWEEDCQPGNPALTKPYCKIDAPLIIAEAMPLFKIEARMGLYKADLLGN